MVSTVESPGIDESQKIDLRISFENELELDLIECVHVQLKAAYPDEKERNTFLTEFATTIQKELLPRLEELALLLGESALFAVKQGASERFDN